MPYTPLTTAASWATFLSIIALALLLIYVLHYQPRHRALTCCRCDRRFTTPAIIDADSWLPIGLQSVYCSTDCLDEHSETYWTHVWSQP